MSSEQSIIAAARIPTIKVESRYDIIPDYLRDVYTWAYLTPLALKIFDHPSVVSAILWGNYHRLIRETLREIGRGQKVLQVACVYGEFSIRLAESIGSAGCLDIIDVAAIQLEKCREKLRHLPYARALLADAANPPEGPYDTVCCFFLLHEVPEDYKAKIVNAALNRVKPGGKLVFVDYHRPALLHPLRPVMWAVFKTLEPFALPLWSNQIMDYATHSDEFTWTKQTFFGGMYQKVVVTRNVADNVK
ncbi:Class I SAM-dependent methyltransferase [uncultured Gammaproteobacteria bacterium]